jgi:hypothetical protein
LPAVPPSAPAVRLADLDAEQVGDAVMPAAGSLQLGTTLAG